MLELRRIFHALNDSNNGNGKSLNGRNNESLKNYILL